MGEVVNLNRARKAKLWTAREAEADANRAKFGRTKASRERETKETARRAKMLEGAKRNEDGS